MVSLEVTCGFVEFCLIFPASAWVQYSGNRQAADVINVIHLSSFSNKGLGETNSNLCGLHFDVIEMCF